MARNYGLFYTKKLDKPVYLLLQRLRVEHSAEQWEVIQASIVAYGSRPKAERQVFLDEVRRAPSDQVEEYPCRD